MGRECHPHLESLQAFLDDPNETNRTAFEKGINQLVRSGVADPQTQSELNSLTGSYTEAYQEMKGIQADLKEKHQALLKAVKPSRQNALEAEVQFLQSKQNALSAEMDNINEKFHQISS